MAGTIGMPQLLFLFVSVLIVWEQLNRRGQP